MPGPPFDLVGDIHGMVRTLEAMVERLGYRREGRRWTHPAGRTLISVGDLLDRGPDPLGSLELVADMVENGRAQVVLGNHEINGVHFVEGLRENSAKNRAQFENTLRQIEAEPARWDRARAFIERCPTRLELDEGRLRVIHACWSHPDVEDLPEFVDSEELWRRTAKGGDLEKAIQRCIKGPEEPCEPFFDKEGTRRKRQRVPWWRTYPAEAPFLAFGHYWFPWTEGGDPPHEPRLLGPGRNAACVDYSAGLGGPLVAFRYPEFEFVSVPGQDETAR